MNAHMKFEISVEKPLKKIVQQQQQPRGYMFAQLQVRHTGGPAEVTHRKALCLDTLEQERQQQMRQQQPQL